MQKTKILKLLVFTLITTILLTQFPITTSALLVGTSTQIWVCGTNPANGNYEIYQINTTKYSLSSSVDVYIQDGQTFSETQLTDLFADYDTYYNQVLYFGNPDKDRDGKIGFVFWNGLGSVAGKYSYIHQLPQYDNKDLLEINITRIQNGYPLNYAKPTIYHELTHMIQTQYCDIDNLYDGTAEGVACYVQKDLGFDMSQRIFQAVINNWNFRSMDYGKDTVLMEYISEHYGGRQTIKDIIQNSTSSMDSIVTLINSKGYNTTLKDLYKNFLLSSKFDRGIYEITAFDMWTYGGKQVNTTFSGLSSSDVVSGWKPKWHYIRPNASSVNIRVNNDSPASGLTDFAVIAVDGTVSGIRIDSIANNPDIRIIQSGNTESFNNLNSNTILFITPLFTPDNPEEIAWDDITSNWSHTVTVTEALATPTPTVTPAPTNTPTPTVTPTNTPTPTATPSPTPTNTPTPVPTNTPTDESAPSVTPVPQPIPTQEPTPTNTPIPTPTNTPIPVPVAVVSNTGGGGGGGGGGMSAPVAYVALPAPAIVQTTVTPAPTSIPTIVPTPTENPKVTPIPTKIPEKDETETPKEKDQTKEVATPEEQTQTDPTSASEVNTPQNSSNTSSVINEMILPSTNDVQTIKDTVTNVTSEQVKQIIQKIPDIQNHWAKESIARLNVDINGKKIINGFPDGSFHPEAKVSIEQFITMTVRTLGFNPVPDTKKWSKPFIDTALEYKLINENEFADYSRDITREQMISIIVRATTLRNKEIPVLETEKKIDDFNDISPQYQDAVLYAYEAHITSGMGNNIFSPKGLSTRAQGAVMMVKLLEQFK
jgi:hypothetical protein